jgi:hypothetical protein
VKMAAWMVVIIVSRELAITGLRLLAASKNIVMAAERHGKHKTLSQIAAIIALLVVDACEEWPDALKHLFTGWMPTFAYIMLWVTVALTAFSGIIYLWGNRKLYLEDMERGRRRPSCETRHTILVSGGAAARYPHHRATDKPPGATAAKDCFSGCASRPGR